MLACVESVSMEQRKSKEQGFPHFARTKNGARAPSFLYYALAHFCTGKTPKTLFFTLSLLHGNACYVGYLDVQTRKAKLSSRPVNLPIAYWHFWEKLWYTDTLSKPRLTKVNLI